MIISHQINNADVHGTTPLSSIFMHDFWGADISNPSSHKSYRPFTVLTFRLDHWWYGFDAKGYHVSNLVIYALCCLVVYVVVKQWMSNQLGELR